MSLDLAGWLPPDSIKDWLAISISQDRKGARGRSAIKVACARRRGDRIGSPAASWCDTAGGSPAQVRRSVRLVASVAWLLATVVTKRTQRLHGVWD